MRGLQHQVGHQLSGLPASLRTRGLLYRPTRPVFPPTRSLPAREIATREPSARSDRSRSPARPCRRPRAPRPGSVVHALPPAPSRQQGIGVSSRSPARPCRRPRAPRPGPVVHEVPPAPSGQQGLRVLLECSARPCRCPRAPQSGRAVCSARHVPRFSLFLSGVTPLSGALHQLGGGVMLPNWCNPP